MTNSIALSLRNTLTGILPPLSMPFDEAGNLVPGALKPQIDFMIESGVRGIVVGGSTGEGHTLSADEFTAAMREAHAANAGRVPSSSASSCSRPARPSIASRRWATSGSTPCRSRPSITSSPGREATIEHFRAIWEATRIPIYL